MGERDYINAKMAEGLTHAEACMCASIEYKLAPEFREGGSQHGYTVKQYLEDRFVGEDYKFVEIPRPKDGWIIDG